MTTRQTLMTVSPFMADLARRYEEDARPRSAQDIEERLQTIFSGLETIDPACSDHQCLSLLRQARNRVALILGLGEMTGALTTKAMCLFLSRFADLCLDFVLSFGLLSHAKQGIITPKDPHYTLDFSNGSDVPVAAITRYFGFFVLALGKHGGQELNYSSDIDPIFFYDPGRVQTTSKKDIADLYVRVARQMIDLLERRTPDGYVFRVDLRLRPNPSSTPLVVSVAAAERYYQAHALHWERAAFIKARPAAGDLQAATAFLGQIHPWLWRKSIDFTALDEVGRLKDQIADQANQSARVDEDINVKLGPGGIREIEFFAQIHQLLYGGKYPDIRTRRTDETLTHLAEIGFIEVPVSAFLIDTYYHLRRVEHACQIIRDEQTHSLPSEPQKLADIAALLGIDHSTLSTDLSARMAAVRQHYGSVFSDRKTTEDVGETSTEQPRDNAFDLAHFSDAETVRSIIKIWLSGQRNALSSAASRRYLSQCLPALLSAFKETPNPDISFARFDKFLSGLPGSAQLFALFAANDNLLRLLVRVFALAPSIGDRLTIHPLMFADVLEPPFYNLLEFDADLDRVVAIYFSDCTCLEEALDSARRCLAELRFRAGIHLLEGLASPELVAQFLSAVADRLIAHLYRETVADFAEKHGVCDDPGLEIMALGRWGGDFLTFSSDLDLIFLYDDQSGTDVQSNGSKPLSRSVYYTRLAQRLSSAFSAPTASGPLFDIDTRLRPAGLQGPLATSLSAFDTYFTSAAWTWEHMAVTRLRGLKLAQGVAKKGFQILTKARSAIDKGSILTHAHAMRIKLARQFYKGHFWDVKHGPGGLIDIEFIVQALTLAALDHASPSGDLIDQVARLIETERLSPDDGNRLIKAYRLQGQILVVLRLSLDDQYPQSETLPPGLETLLLTSLKAFNSLEMLKQRLIADQNRIKDIYLQTFKGDPVDDGNTQTGDRL